MSLSINIVHAAGYLGRDPEIKYAESGAAICTFSFASTETWKDKQGVKQERTTWFNCKAWNKTAEHVAKYFTKGEPIFVVGKYQMDEYEDKNGDQKRFHYINVQRAEFLPRPRRPSETGAISDDPTLMNEANSAFADAVDDVTEDIPFGFVLPFLLTSVLAGSSYAQGVFHVVMRLS